MIALFVAKTHCGPAEFFVRKERNEKLNTILTLDNSKLKCAHKFFRLTANLLLELFKPHLLTIKYQKVILIVRSKPIFSACVGVRNLIFTRFQ